MPAAEARADKIARELGKNGGLRRNGCIVVTDEAGREIYKTPIRL
jgi:hypothetical protein